MRCTHRLAPDGPQRSRACRRVARWRLVTPQHVGYACDRCVADARAPWAVCVVEAVDARKPLAE